MHVNVALVTKVEKILPTPEVSIMSAWMCIIVPSTHGISPSHRNAVNLKENMEVNFRAVVVVLLF